jgi:MraZ protein
VSIPPLLRRFACLDKDLTVNGADEKVEIWDRATWETYRDQAEDAFANLDAPFSL